jgi:hypothetical protein
MVEVAVGVGDDQPVVLARVLGEPRVDDSVDRPAQRIPGGLFTAPVSNRTARSLPNNRYRNGASALRALLWRST